MRDLRDAPESEWRAERTTVETEGWGARLLSCQDEDGQWAGDAFVPSGFDWNEWQEVGQPWTATAFSLSQLREFGLDPASERARRTVELIGANSRWDHAGQPCSRGEDFFCRCLARLARAAGLSPQATQSTLMLGTGAFRSW